MPSNIPIVTLGVFILWLGWFGFNGGSQLALGGAIDAVAMSNVLVNTNLAAAAGVMAAISVSRPLLGRLDLLAGLNGAIAGLVSITAGPDILDHRWAVVIGAVGGVLCTAGIRLLEHMKVDDVVGAVPAHLIAGVWGTLAVCIAAGGNFMVQLDRCAGGRRFRFRYLARTVVRHRKNHRRTGIAQRRGSRPGFGGTRNRGLSRVRAHAGSGYRGGVAAESLIGGLQ